MHLEKHIHSYMENNLPLFKEVVKKLYDHPEIGNEEFESAKTICTLLEEENFNVEKPYILPTGFKAVYEGCKPGLNIAFLCEYDALPEIGHGCGHNLIAAISLGAACAMKKIVDTCGGTIYVFGTPAEETDGGKVYMANANAFDTMDAAFMIHPDTTSTLAARTLSINPVRFEFFGKNAHACDPYNGNSALDAAVLSYTSINMLRQFAKSGTFIHGIFKNGGTAANIIPDYACLDYYFRSPSMPYTLEISDKGEECVKGACLATGCTYKKSIYECPYDDCIINYTLCDMLKEEYEKLDVEDIMPVSEIPNGSSDIGSVSYRCPTLHGYIKIANSDINCHSVEFADATISPKGDEALLKGAIALAQIARRLIVEEGAMDKVKEEFNKK